MSLYTDLTAAGIPTDNHESDLYVLATPEARELVRKHGHGSPASFVSAIDGKLWFDLPFQFDPFWERRARKAVRS
jgi:hypothetical protein